MSRALSPLIRNENIAALLISQALCLLPLFNRLPFWVWGLWILALAWRGAMLLGWSRPATWTLKALLLGACLAGLAVTFPKQNTLDAMVGLLVCSFVLKIIELQHRQDGLLVVFIGFIAIAAQWLFNQSLGAGLYGVLCCVFLLSAWLGIYYTKPRHWAKKLQAAALIMAQGAPLFVVLFVVMPRLGPLWSVPMPAKTGTTGFSNHLQLGDISQLVQSAEPAFRVTFEGAPPQAKNLYWRGLVLDAFDGTRWDMGEVFEKQQPLHSLPTAHLQDYQIMMEPHQQPWLFSLPWPVSASAPMGGVSVNAQQLVVSATPITQRMAYRVTGVAPSALPPPAPLTPAQQRWYTSLPAHSQPQAQALAAQWVAAGLSPAQKMQQALQLFNSAFTYTLNPPPLGEHAIDAFLFSTRQGFCEHFASSFVFLMRAAGVPARLVVGYQGGQWNDVEAYLLVRQQDAHAWAEVWLADQGWVTIDPTAAVAPERVLQGVEPALQPSERQQLAQAWGSGQWLQWQKRLDAMGYAWNRWVLHYDSQQQQGLFQRLLGGSSPWRLGGALLGFALLMAVLLSLWAMRQQVKAPVGLQAQLLKPLQKRLNAQGIHWQPQESPRHFLMRFARENPQHGNACRRLLQLIERVVYADDTRAKGVLIKHIRTFPKLPKE